MSTLMQLEEEIKNLPEKDFMAFREWFQDFESRKWDTQVEEDIQSGKLDDLAKQAILAFKDGNFKRL